VGHAGTLDRFACGLLVVLAGAYSRLAPYVVAGEKRYRGLIAFGSETDTLDPEGEVTATAEPPSREALEAALALFRGPIMQVPPVYSAIHVDGKRAYQLARGGADPILKERRVEIRSLELLSFDGRSALVDVSCSSGTYIRSLARDVAAACGSRAHLAALERLAIGPYRVEDAVSAEAFDPATDLRSFRPEDASALGLRRLLLGEGEPTERFGNGGRLAPESFAGMDGGGSAADGSEAAVFGPSGAFLGVILLGAEGPKYRLVMPLQAGRAG
jgi:tRNA pseudouridine55 synthase